MRGLTGLFVATSLVAFAAFIVVMAISIRGPAGRRPSEAAIEGKKAWQRRGCVECHTIFGNGGYNAPDLTREVSGRGVPWISHFLQDPPVMRPGTRERHPALNPDEAQSLIEYLKHLDRIVTPGWPPEPAKPK